MVKHPAAFPPAILETLRELIPSGLVLDVFGGIGKLGRLGAEWRVISHEIEPEWAVQGYANYCALTIIGDSTALPFGDTTIPNIATSCAYGNRLADSYVPSNDNVSHRTRRSYRIYLRRPLHYNNGGGMQWGIDYRKLHYRVWLECYRVLRIGGALYLNCKNHVRNNVLQPVVAWHAAALDNIGFTLEARYCIQLKGDQNTNRMRKQGLAVVDHEEILVWRKE